VRLTPAETPNQLGNEYRIADRQLINPASHGE